ncbi:DUF1289 domain-containing protein [Hydrogenophaga sp. A37]|uniref:DUF1289 domain-containing protein n=1 Tax=Hydrogenophaga sp. A37 TaxID=1945864 RepID=UPI0026ADFABF
MFLKKLFSRTPAPVPRMRPLINLDDARARHVDPEVPSPCISVCQMNPATDLCSGCYRTVEEIAAWSGLGDQARLVVWERIEARQQPQG